MALSLTDHKTLKQAEVTTVKNYLTGSIFGIEEGFAAKFNFIVHYYQRKYEWDEKNISEFLNSLFDVSLIDDSDMFYSEIGNVITQPINSEYLALLDGQQRTTTLSFIAIFLEQILSSKISILQDLKREEEKIKGTSVIGIDNILRKYLNTENITTMSLTSGIVKVENNIEVPRLNVYNSEKYKSFYSALVKNRAEIVSIFFTEETQRKKYIKTLEILNYTPKNVEKDIKEFKATLEALNSIAKYFKNKQRLDIMFDKRYNIYTSNLDISNIMNFINKFFSTLITIEVISKEANASAIFQNKNSKGKPLKSIDLVKSAFIKADALNAKSINDFFNRLGNELGENMLNKYILNSFYIYFPDTTKKEKINSMEKLSLFLNFSDITQSWKKQEIVAYLNLLQKNEEKFKRILLLELPFEEAKEYLFLLNKLDLTELYTAFLLKYYPEDIQNKNHKNKYLNLLKDIIKTFITGIANGYSNFDFKNNLLNQSALPNLLEEIDKGGSFYKIVFEKENLKEAEKNRIASRWEDYSFINVRHGILYLYELALNYNSLKDLESVYKTLSTIKLEAEHIIPLEHNLLNIVPINKTDINKIGNFLLLDKKSNDKASNNSFLIKKQSTYINQTNKLKQIDEIMNYSDFSNVNHIDERTMKIIQEIYRFLDLTLN